MSTSKVKQVGGDHYQTGKAEQHWDRVWKLYGRGYFVGCATKYIERYHEKNGKQDLEKAISFIQKLIELEYPDPVELPTLVERRKDEAKMPLILSENYSRSMEGSFVCRRCGVEKHSSSDALLHLKVHHGIG